MSIVKGKSAAGLTYSSMILEILMVTMVVGYNQHYSYPLSTYGEAIIILVQCYIILYLAWNYK